MGFVPNRTTVIDYNGWALHAVTFAPTGGASTYYVRCAFHFVGIVKREGRSGWVIRRNLPGIGWGKPIRAKTRIEAARMVVSTLRPAELLPAYNYGDFLTEYVKCGTPRAVYSLGLLQDEADGDNLLVDLDMPSPDADNA